MAKNIAHSVRERLLNTAKKLGVDYQVILTRYFHERFLYRLSQSPYKENFCLKGGTLLFAYEKFLARPTLDMDFSANKISNNMQNIRNAVAEICQIECSEDGVIFDTDSVSAESITEFKEYHGVRVHFKGFLGSIRQQISIDFGFGDSIFPAPQELPFPNILADTPTATLIAYPLETVIAEKFQSMIELADQNSRMKDFFDIYNILINYTFDQDILASAIQKTFQNRNTVVTSDSILFDSDFGNSEKMNRLWKAFLEKIHSKDNLEFNDVWNFIKGHLSRFVETTTR
ncbi:nucleotidyl transferase AbiEii/AbiGii toxin family protein [Fibrobacter sp. UWB10]|uniref:nucleotidyl transferase AbiEii/AbiGii toxin family protein n=1 Tax=Fibrobacter sp. UWB10 TaxID=1896201 RepID=UPI00240329CD|nr:nucleotidyl transferase AbiEii/AbiGii toxin family protein [Fibrobacter sp. UWB10]SMP42381.1 Predicted nucleotidyltransferase component of viral defense system [Fibrobacter sp. UWB10]